MPAPLAVAALIGAFAVAIYAVMRLRQRKAVATPAQRATYGVLHTAGLAVEPLRHGLTQATAAKSVKHLRTLVGADGLALLTGQDVLAFDGGGAHHRAQLAEAAAKSIATGRSTVLGLDDLPCDQIDCTIRGAIIAPLHSVPAAVAATAAEPPSPGLVQATLETARWVSTQLALHELDSSRERLAQAELRALRAQISPHFIYNALGAIASFVRTDPDRARDLILEFAEFTRYSFRSHGEFTTLAEELRSIDRYLTLEKARFGERLKVRLRIAPEVLPVVLPFLCVQPLVENAVRHGLSRKPGAGTVSIEASDAGAECHITVEDDGVGMDPAVLMSTAPAEDGQHVGLSNVDDRLRAVFGDEFGLVVETALGAGTKVSMRVPKFHPGVVAK
ncbi:sensor histidine kinase [Catelliglobosispora koreensis]|uniref:sensor histidine kinase n=1 Tax=Catelliglobosispora koreensis TaxID=129052 RepID=UPI00035F779B|nr:histidine kinase [Catelliglobosispora koreensis]